MNAPSFLLTKQKTAALVLTLFIFGVFQPTDTLLDDQETQGTKPVEETSLVVPKAPAVQALPEVDQALITVLVEKNPLFGCWHEFVLSIESNEKTRTLLIDFLARIMLHTGHYSSPLEQIEAEFFKKLNTDCQKFFINAINRLDRSAKTLSPEAFAKLLRTVFAQLFSEINKLINKSTIARTPRFSDTCTKFFASVKPFVAVGWKEWSLGWLNWKAPVAAFFTAGTVCLGCLTWLICKRVAPVVQRVEKIGEESENQLFGPIVQGPLPAGVKGPLRGPGLIVKAKDAVAEAEAMAQRVETEILGNPEVRNEAGVVVTPAVLGLAQRLEVKFYQELRDLRQMIDAWNGRFTGDYQTAKAKLLQLELEVKVWNEKATKLEQTIRGYTSDYKFAVVELQGEIKSNFQIQLNSSAKHLLEVETSLERFGITGPSIVAFGEPYQELLRGIGQKLDGYIRSKVRDDLPMATVKNELVAPFTIALEIARFKVQVETANCTFADIKNAFAGLTASEGLGDHARGPREGSSPGAGLPVTGRAVGIIPAGGCIGAGKGHAPSEGDKNAGATGIAIRNSANLDLYRAKVMEQLYVDLLKLLNEGLPTYAAVPQFQQGRQMFGSGMPRAAGNTGGFVSSMLPN